mmetsp:Transcript_2028/g.5738  ORF Transcript_2028/g.5738 Transcript_2028/m.5738 type:complete len:279 (-) Transcript_2028:136-972(-)
MLGGDCPDLFGEVAPSRYGARHLNIDDVAQSGKVDGGRGRLQAPLRHPAEVAPRPLAVRQRASEEDDVPRGAHDAAGGMLEEPGVRVALLARSALLLEAVLGPPAEPHDVHREAGGGGDEGALAFGTGVVAGAGRLDASHDADSGAELRPWGAEDRQPLVAVGASIFEDRAEQVIDRVLPSLPGLQEEHEAAGLPHQVDHELHALRREQGEAVRRHLHYPGLPGQGGGQLVEIGALALQRAAKNGHQLARQPPVLAAADKNCTRHLPGLAIAIRGAHL